MRQQYSSARLLASAALTVVLATGLGSCQTMSDITGAITPSTSRTEPAPAADPKAAMEAYGDRYRANPKDADAALAYGEALRANGQRAQAAAVLEQATINNPGNKALLAGWGRALADNGNFQQAFDILSKAHTPENPDWRILSVQGTVLDQMGRHDEARRYYASALKIVPGEASVLSKRHFEEWGERYLDTEHGSRSRSPAAVKVPGGAFQDIYDAFAGELAYDPALVRAPVAIIRGEWDSLCTDTDARWLFDALRNSPLRRDVKIARATHLMHLEENRFALYRETECFLAAGDANQA